MSKVDRAKNGPGWGEVILGAALSLVLGVAIGAALLILKPAVPAKQTPKDAVPGAVYYVEGQRGGPTEAKQAKAKEQALVSGQSVKVTEAEINALAAGSTAAKPGEKPAEPAGDTVAAGVPNVRIHDGVLQVAVPVTLNVLGLQQKIIAQARGGFEKDGDVYVYEPTEMYFGSCPVQRLPFLSSYIRGKLLDSKHVPAELAAAWSKLRSVTVEGNTLNLSM